jgi:hypothetical protein
VLAALAGWIGVTVFVVAGLLTLALEVRDQLGAIPGTGRRLRRGRGAGLPLGWLLPVLVAAALAVTVVRFAVLLG